jgi:hypothetical protein
MVSSSLKSKQNQKEEKSEGNLWRERIPVALSHSGQGSNLLTRSIWKVGLAHITKQLHKCLFIRKN